MGSKDTPEKHNEEENDIGSMESPDFIIAAGSSDEDSDDEDSPDNQGYQLLPQDPDMETSVPEEEEPPISHSPNLNAVDQVIVSSMDASDYVGGFGSSMFNVSKLTCWCFFLWQLGFSFAYSILHYKSNIVLQFKYILLI